MNEILDHNPKNTPKYKLFSKLAFGVGVMIIFMFLADSIFPIGELLIRDDIYPYIFYSFCILSFLGLLLSILSYIKNEKNNFYQVIGLIFNILFFLFAIILIIYHARNIRS